MRSNISHCFHHCWRLILSPWHLWQFVHRSIWMLRRFTRQCCSTRDAMVFDVFSCFMQEGDCSPAACGCALKQRYAMRTLASFVAKSCLGLGLDPFPILSPALLGAKRDFDRVTFSTNDSDNSTRMKCFMQVEVVLCALR